MNIDIVGGGSLGLLLAGKLANVPAGVRVRLIARTKEQAERIDNEGIAVRETDGTVRRSRVPCADFAAAAAGPAAADWLWFATKQTHWSDVLLAYAARAARAGTRLLLFQNGVGHVDRLEAEGVPKERVYVAVTTEGAKKTAPDAVSHTGSGTTTLGGPELEPLRPVESVLQAAGFAADVVPDVERFVYRKLLTNSVINPLTAILRVTNGELAASPHYRAVMRTLFDEAVAAFPGLGAEDPVAAWNGVLDVCERTAGNASSMLQDVIAGRETEIESITGAVLRAAASSGTAAPTHAAVYAMVKGLTSGADADSQSRDS